MSYGKKREIIARMKPWNRALRKGNCPCVDGNDAFLADAFIRAVVGFCAQFVILARHRRHYTISSGY